VTDQTKPPASRRLRSVCQDLALQSALRKRAAGAPSFTIAEAAALCSVSPEHLYRMVRGGGFPAIRMRAGAEQGRYVVPAKAVEKVLDDATAASACLDSPEWAAVWDPARETTASTPEEFVADVARGVG
jgi:excisionase family DNA binding protein